MLEVRRDGREPQIHHDLRDGDRMRSASKYEGSRCGWDWERVRYSHGDQAQGIGGIVSKWYGRSGYELCVCRDRRNRKAGGVGKAVGAEYKNMVVESRK